MRNHNTEVETRGPIISTHKFLTLYSKRAGFTLLEIMIALAIVGTAFIVVFNTVNYHADIAHDHTVTTRMLLFAKEKLAEVELKPVNQRGSSPDAEFSFETTVNHANAGTTEGVSEILELKAVVRGHGREIELSQLVTGSKNGQ